MQEKKYEFFIHFDREGTATAKVQEKKEVRISAPRR
jgi:hypothetical protein